MLIVDRKMPFLQRRCEDLASQMADVTVTVDRRVVQDRYDHLDRRINGYDEESGPLRPRQTQEQNIPSRDINPL